MFPRYIHACANVATFRFTSPLEEDSRKNNSRATPIMRTGGCAIGFPAWCRNKSIVKVSHPLAWGNILPISAEPDAIGHRRCLWRARETLTLTYSRPPTYCVLPRPVLSSWLHANFVAREDRAASAKGETCVQYCPEIPSGVWAIRFSSAAVRLGWAGHESDRKMCE